MNKLTFSMVRRCRYAMSRSTSDETKRTDAVVLDGPVVGSLANAQKQSINLYNPIALHCEGNTTVWSGWPV